MSHFWRHSTKVRVKALQSTVFVVHNITAGEAATLPPDDTEFVETEEEKSFLADNRKIVFLHCVTIVCGMLWWILCDLCNRESLEVTWELFTQIIFVLSLSCEQVTGFRSILCLFWITGILSFDRYFKWKKRAKAREGNDSKLYWVWTRHETTNPYQTEDHSLHGKFRVQYLYLFKYYFKFKITSGAYQLWSTARIIPEFEILKTYYFKQGSSKIVGCDISSHFYRYKECDSDIINILSYTHAVFHVPVNVENL